MSFRGGDQVVDMVVIEPGKSLLTVCEKGLGKRSSIEEYRLTKRGGMGVINIKVTERNGPVVALKSVVDTDEIMMITAEGIMLRTDLSEIREIGRATQGVRLIRVDKGDKLVSVAHIAREEDALGAEEQGPAGATDWGEKAAGEGAVETARVQPEPGEPDAGAVEEQGEEESGSEPGNTGEPGQP